MQWTHPSILSLTVPAVILMAWLVWRAARRRRAALAAFGVRTADRLQGLVRARNWSSVLLVTAVGLMGLALAGPRYGVATEERVQEGIDLVIALDVSRSMLAEDVPPSRLERARFELERAVDQLAGSRIGVVIFAGEAFLQSPLTTDLGTVRRVLSTAHPDLIPAQGTDIGAAIRTSVDAFSFADGENAPPRTRAVVVVTDGEDHPARVAQALRQAENAGVTVLAVGVGTPDGAPIPVGGTVAGPGYHRDRSGSAVETRLDESTLRQIGGSRGYVVIGGGSGSLVETVAALRALDQSTLGVETASVMAHRYQWPLALAVVCLILFGIAETRLVGRDFT